jgi:hypothetical protein
MQWLNANSGAIQAIFAGLLVVLTLFYVLFTHKLRRATDSLAAIAADQAKLLAAGQRAYLSVEPLGIALMVAGDSVLGHVSIHNAGHLPAIQVGWFVTIERSADGLKRDFELGEVRGNVVSPPGARMPRGSRTSVLVQDLQRDCGADAGRPRHQQAELYLYVWGVVEYHDGLGQPRWTRFCHRYNWIKRSSVPGDYAIDKSHARYHEYGNGTDESPGA